MGKNNKGTITIQKLIAELNRNTGIFIALVVSAFMRDILKTCREAIRYIIKGYGSIQHFAHEPPYAYFYEITFDLLSVIAIIIVAISVIRYEENK